MLRKLYAYLSSIASSQESRLERTWEGHPYLIRPLNLDSDSEDVANANHQPGSDPQQGPGPGSFKSSDSVLGATPASTFTPYGRILRSRAFRIPLVFALDVVHRSLTYLKTPLAFVIFLYCLSLLVVGLSFQVKSHCVMLGWCQQHSHPASNTFERLNLLNSTDDALSTPSSILVSLREASRAVETFKEYVHRLSDQEHSGALIVDVLSDFEKKIDDAASSVRTLASEMLSSRSAISSFTGTAASQPLSSIWWNNPLSLPSPRDDIWFIDTVFLEGLATEMHILAGSHSALRLAIIELEQMLSAAGSCFVGIEMDVKRAIISSRSPSLSWWGFNRYRAVSAELHVEYARDMRGLLSLASSKLEVVEQKLGFSDAAIKALHKLLITALAPVPGGEKAPSSTSSHGLRQLLLWMGSGLA